MMADDKFNMLALLQHIERMRAKGVDFFADKGPVALAEWKETFLPNPFLELGILADEREDTPFDQFLFPDSVVAKKKIGPSQEEQMRQLRLPSLWAGWMFDEGMQRSGWCPADRVTRIMTERLLSDGPYPFHDALFITKKMVTAGFEPQAWSAKAPQHFVIDYSWFLADDNAKKFEPKDRAGRDLYRRFTTNSMKMALYLYKDQLQTSRVKYPGDPSPDQIAKIESYVKQAEPSQSREVDALAQQISELGASATLYAGK